MSVRRKFGFPLEHFVVEAEFALQLILAWVNDCQSAEFH